MRAVKAVLSTASLIRREQESEAEDKIVYKALMDVNLPKFLA